MRHLADSRNLEIQCNPAPRARDTARDTPCLFQILQLSGTMLPAWNRLAEQAAEKRDSKLTKRDAAHRRAQARDARIAADTMRNAAAKKTMLAVADSYEKLAGLEERRGRPPP